MYFFGFLHLLVCLLFFYLVLLCFIFFFFFFFSSRRRHTRCLSDWSSDVCSSDLELMLAVTDGRRRFPIVIVQERVLANPTRVELQRVLDDCRIQPEVARSEERRVGKECRSRWSRYREKKKTKQKEEEMIEKRGEA